MKRKNIFKLTGRNGDKILQLYKELRKKRPIDELLFFKTIVWACLEKQKEEDACCWMSPYVMFVMPKSYMGTISLIDNAYRAYCTNKDYYDYFNYNIKDNFGKLL
jgi:hypothetical protein